MEHFLPLAIASMVISLISIILLDYFGPSTSNIIEKETLPESEDSIKDQSLTTEQVDAETNMGIAAGQSKPIKTAESLENSNENPTINSFYGIGDVIINKAYLQIGRL